jgi:aldehyde:ferredoxin oxidoreductase
MKKILRINLDTCGYQLAESDQFHSNLGGRAFTSRIISEEVPPAADPLGPDNKLVFAPGLLAGTRAPNSGRLSMGAKSPLTNTIKEANVGGSAAQKLATLGLQALVLEGRAEELTLIKVDKEGVNFLPASHMKGVGNYETIEILKKQFGENSAIISIGPAGEMCYKAASIASTTPDFQLRMAGRGGLGAVMGSKNLKAVVIDDTGSNAVEVTDERKMKEAAAALSRGILSHPLIDGLKQFGTPILVMMINTAGCLPTKNYSTGQFAGAEKISGEHIAELMQKRPKGQPVHRCMNGCIIHCSNIFTDEGGTAIVSGLEYETLALVGSNCMIDDIDTIARINYVCNDVGVDTMDVGAAIALTMEAGIIPWGDGERALALVGEIVQGTEMGSAIANGCRFTGEKLGVKRIPHVKGQSLSGYDPRVLKGTGVTYATSPMGADHTCGNALPSPANPDYDSTSPSGQGEISGFLQRYFAAIDSLGLCLFASLPLLDMPDLQKHLIACASAVTGEPEVENDRLPGFFSVEPLPPSGLVFDVPEADLDGVNNS